MARTSTKFAERCIRRLWRKRWPRQKGQFDLGVTFDGDADRALFSDADGRVVNGDAVLLLVARDMQARGILNGVAVVATTMSNMGSGDGAAQIGDPDVARQCRR